MEEFARNKEHILICYVISTLRQAKECMTIKMRNKPEAINIVLPADSMHTMNKLLIDIFVVNQGLQ